MEIGEQLEARNIWLDLEWVPRDQNEEADALSNMVFTGFDEKKRVEVELADVKWILLDEFMAYGLEFYKHMEALKQKKKEQEVAQLEDWRDEDDEDDVHAKKARKRLPTDKLRFTNPW